MKRNEVWQPELGALGGEKRGEGSLDWAELSLTGWRKMEEGREERN